MKSDRMLFWMIILIAAISVTAIIVYVFQEEAQYMNENTPEAVVHDFVLAFSREDYKKAHEYVISKVPYEGFLDNLLYDRDYYQNYGVVILDSRIQDSETAIVSYYVSSDSRGMFGGSYEYEEQAILKIEEEGGDWKIARMYPYLMQYIFEEVEPAKEP